MKMEYIEDIKRPSKEEQQAALESYNALSSTVEELDSKYPLIEIEETEEKIRIPLKALKLLVEILKATSQGIPISIVPLATELTTQSAADFLGCSRPHLVKLLENGEIPFTKVGRHRRVKYEDVVDYKKKLKEEQKRRLIQMMKDDEGLGLYDS
jgi:excisionase family DNA binding protein